MKTIKFDYRYLLLDTKRMYVASRHYFYKTDKEATKIISELEKSLGYVCLEVQKSLNDAECEEGNEYYKSVWMLGHEAFNNLINEYERKNK